MRACPQMASIDALRILHLLLTTFFSIFGVWTIRPPKVHSSVPFKITAATRK
jgi:hypothetical protein